MNASGARMIRLLGVAICLLGCAAYAARTPERVDRVPAGQYQVVLSESRAGSGDYDAVLFNLATPAVTLGLPSAALRGVATPDDYAAVLRPGFAIYEIRGESGAAQAYLLVPAQARVTVWSRHESRSGIVVTVTGLPGATEGTGGSGGGASGGGAM